MASPETSGAGDSWRSGNLDQYTPAYPLGNLRDIELISKSSGRSIEEVQTMIGPRQIEAVPDYPPSDWEVSGEQKEA